MSKADIALIGLGVMGSALASHLAEKNWKVAVYDQNPEETVSSFVKSSNVQGCYSLEELVQNTQAPRKIFLMIKAGQPVEDYTQRLLDLLDKDDIIIDGGNSYFVDTNRRFQQCQEHGIHFLGVGVSGGEEGARHGASIMPGGSIFAWEESKNILQSLATQNDQGEICCQYMGPQGAGHFVKMVHNGIEYAIMQLICETYHFMKSSMGISLAEMATILESWLTKEASCYLLEITVDILRHQDEEAGLPTLDLILDTAGQKGTGKWTSQVALDLGVAIPTIAEATQCRFLSARKKERLHAETVISLTNSYQTDLASEQIYDAFYGTMISCYAQGFALLQQASQDYNWELDLSKVALTWQNGCIIRAKVLQEIRQIFTKATDINNLLLAYAKPLARVHRNWRQFIASGIMSGIPLPASSSALQYFDSYRHGTLPANLLQAQRDYFGAHGYQRIDRDGNFHTNWR